MQIGKFVTSIELTVISGLRLENSVDSRRVIIQDTREWKSIELPIQAVEALAVWWINHGSIPEEQHTKEKESKL